MAWKSACKVPEGVVQIPLGHKFLIKPVTLQGPCTGHVTFQVTFSILFLLCNMSKKRRKKRFFFFGI